MLSTKEEVEQLKLIARPRGGPPGSTHVTLSAEEVWNLCSDWLRMFERCGMADGAARLRRLHDDLVAEYEATNSEIIRQAIAFVEVGIFAMERGYLSPEGAK